MDILIEQMLNPFCLFMVAVWEFNCEIKDVQTDMFSQLTMLYEGDTALEIMISHVT